MDAALARIVWQRARNRCEYCQMSRELDDTPFEIDHICSQKHHGPTVASNLALSCFHCNSFKGSDISSIDGVTRKLTPLHDLAGSPLVSRVPPARISGVTVARITTVPTPSQTL